jgi:hypothetical protein
MFGESPDSLSASSIEPETRRERLRFTDFTFKRAPSGRCSADVTLEWREGERFSGRSEGLSSPYADLRYAAEAALRALQAFGRNTITFDLVGVKALRAFDANVVIVSVLTRHQGKEHRVLGCHLADEDPLRGAVLAALQATNRLLGWVAREA